MQQQINTSSALNVEEDRSQQQQDASLRLEAANDQDMQDSEASWVELESGRVQLSLASEVGKLKGELIPDQTHRIKFFLRHSKLVLNTLREKQCEIVSIGHEVILLKSKEQVVIHIHPTHGVVEGEDLYQQVCVNRRAKAEACPLRDLYRSAVLRLEANASKEGKDAQAFSFVPESLHGINLSALTKPLISGQNESVWAFFDEHAEVVANASEIKEMVDYVSEQV